MDRTGAYIKSRLVLMGKSTGREVKEYAKRKGGIYDCDIIGL